MRPKALSTRWLRQDVRPADSILFACARQNFQTPHREAIEEICRRENVEWEAVYATAEQHGVAPLVYNNLRQCDAATLRLSPEDENRFRLCTVRNVAAKEELARKLSTLLSFFHAKSIPIMFIKGTALDALVYAQPWYMMAGDADLIIKTRVEEMSDEAHAEIWAQTRDLGWLECDYFEHHDINMKGVLPVNFQRIWDDANLIQFRGQDVYVPSPEDLLTSACVNSCRKRFFRLKALCDIAEVTHKYPAMRWDDFIAKVRDYDCHPIVYAALFITQTMVGCEIPDGLLDRLSVHPLRAAAIRFLSQRLSLNPLSALYAGRNTYGKRMGLSLLLPYATYRWYQIGRNVKVACREMRRYARQEKQ
jgi:hypothetical protein